MPWRDWPPWRARAIRQANDAKADEERARQDDRFDRIRELSDDFAREHREGIQGLLTHIDGLASELQIERERLRAEEGWKDFREWGGLIVTVIAAGIALSTLRVYGRQLSVMQAQVREMQAEQRAWVSLSADSGISSMSIDSVNKDLRATVKASLQNTGKNPAVSAFINAEISVGETLPYGSMQSWQRSVCTRPNGDLGITLFPGSPPFTFETNTGLVETERSYWSRLIERSPLVPVIVVCIIYRDAVTGLEHWTPLAFQVRTREGSAVGIGDLPMQGPDLVLHPWVRGGLPPT
jgi:hypothetical protein